MENRKITIREQLPVFLSQFLLCVAMVGVYAILNRLTWAVLVGAGIGTAVSLLNHLALIISVLRAEQSDSPAKGQLKAQGNMMLRFLLMIGILVLALKLWETDPIATLLPLILMRIALFIGGLLIKNHPVDYTPVQFDEPETRNGEFDANFDSNLDSDSNEGGTV